MDVAFFQLAELFDDLERCRNKEKRRTSLQQTIEDFKRANSGDAYPLMRLLLPHVGFKALRNFSDALASWTLSGGAMDLKSQSSQR